MENPTCPICQQPMTLYRTETSQNSKTGQLYARTRYKCPQDDTWARLEIPQPREMKGQKTILE